MGRDAIVRPLREIAPHFNPLSPHGERRSCSRPSGRWRRFQSTLPAWGETRPPTDDPPRHNFNPLSPHGERRTTLTLIWTNRTISIHSPRMGRDSCADWRIRRETEFQSTLPAWGETHSHARPSWPPLFQSTLPAWGETVLPDRRVQPRPISIHSPRMGRDVAQYHTSGWLAISIHSPRMGRD